MYVINRLPMSILEYQSPYAVLFGKALIIPYCILLTVYTIFTLIILNIINFLPELVRANLWVMMMNIKGTGTMIILQEKYYKFKECSF